MSGISAGIHRGEIIRVVWRDACEGPVEQDLSQQTGTMLRGSTSVVIASTGRYLKVSNGYVILDDVIHEESGGTVLFEKTAQGKWLSIPLGVIIHVTPLGEIAGHIAQETKRRRTVFRQLRFIPRAKRTATGELSRTLYVV